MGNALDDLIEQITAQAEFMDIASSDSRFDQRQDNLTQLSHALLEWIARSAMLCANFAGEYRGSSCTIKDRAQCLSNSGMLARRNDISVYSRKPT